MNNSQAMDMVELANFSCTTCDDWAVPGGQSYTLQHSAYVLQVACAVENYIEYSTVLYLLYLPYSILTHVTLEDVERYIIMYVEYSTLCGGEAVNTRNADSAPPLHGLNGTSSRNRLPRCTPYTRR